MHYFCHFVTVRHKHVYAGAVPVEYGGFGDIWKEGDRRVIYFQGSWENGHLFSGVWEEGPIIFRGLGSKHTELLGAEEKGLESCRNRSWHYSVSGSRELNSLGRASKLAMFTRDCPVYQLS